MTTLVKESINLDMLEKIDIRVGTIKSVEDIARSNKLVKLTVDFGDFTRTILVGMKAERENPKEIEENRLCLSSILSLENGRRDFGRMLFDSGYADGVVPVLAQPEKPVLDGTRAG